VPKVLGVQAEGCKPFLTAWRADGKLNPCDADTLADSIAVGHPRNFVKGMRAITESGGAFISVTDQEILDAIPMLARKAGVFGEPAGVAGAAGVRRAVETGVIDPSESVAIIVTGNGLKDIQSAIRSVGRPISVRPDLEEVRKALEVSVTY
jgi:threonine synthase